MDLLERYLQAVKFWLPKAQKQDIIAELSEDIRSEIEEKESTLGRGLNEAELSDLLKKRGRPVFVANRYLPQEQLIGPVLFPIYRLVLKIVLACYLVPAVLVWIILMVFNSGYRAAHANVLETLGSIWSTLWFSAFVAAAAITLVFAILERVQFRSRLEDWNPRSLPAVRKNANLIPRFGSIVEIAANTFLVVWLTTYNMSSTTIFNFANFQVFLSPAWRYVFWGFLLLALVNIALAAANLARPYWSASRATIRLLSDVGGSVIFASLFKIHILTGFAATDVSPERAAEITSAINFWTGKMFAAAVVFGVIILCIDAFRIFRVKWCASPAPKSTSTVIA
ncbi:MAG TPA: hypothetical protein VN982_07055 [Candidatus Dormibacteraeota bacterium]|nr:hypothetical protein [Candidatus Dormibacteraeota bacterium]